MNCYTLLQLNVNGISTKIPDLQLLADLRRHICLLTDTRLSSFSNLSFPSYFVYSTPTLSPHVGGVTYLIHHSLPFSLDQKLSQQHRSWSSICIKVHLLRPITLIGMYRHPRYQPTPSFRSFMQKYTPSRSVIIWGDLNAKHPMWGNPRTNPTGIFLTSFVKTVIYPPTHTFPQHTRASTIDLLLTSYPSDFSSCSTSQPPYGTDHLPVT